MKYTHTPHPTTYQGVRFRSRLEARWAAFFDLAGWSWEYEPVELAGWAPDFLLHVPTPLYVEVKPHLTLEAFHGHTVWSLMDGDYSPIPAAFGNSPITTRWHENGAPQSVPTRVPHWDRLWKDAEPRTPWRRPA